MADLCFIHPITRTFKIRSRQCSCLVQTDMTVWRISGWCFIPKPSEFFRLKSSSYYRWTVWADILQAVLQDHRRWIRNHMTLQLPLGGSWGGVGGGVIVQLWDNCSRVSAEHAIKVLGYANRLYSKALLKTKLPSSRHRVSFKSIETISQ